MLYPPRDGVDPPGPVTSFRWEMWRQGQEDLEVLKLLRAKRGGAPMLNVDDIVTEFPNVDPINNQPYTLDTNVFEAKRESVANYLRWKLPEIGTSLVKVKK